MKFLKIKQAICLVPTEFYSFDISLVSDAKNFNYFNKNEIKIENVFNYTYGICVSQSFYF